MIRFPSINPQEILVVIDGGGDAVLVVEDTLENKWVKAHVERANVAGSDWSMLRYKLAEVMVPSRTSPRAAEG